MKNKFNWFNIMSNEDLKTNSLIKRRVFFSFKYFTNCAFFFSTKVVTTFIPLRIPFGRFVGRSGLPVLACSSARCFKRSFFSARVSGRYFSSNLNNEVDVCLSSV